MNILQVPRHAGAILGLATLLTLAGCQSRPPPAPSPPPPSRAQVLERAGFVRTDAGWTLSMDSRLLFSTDSVDLSVSARQDLQRLCDVLQSVGVDALRIEGHTDNTGSPEYNLKLSLQRAQGVAAELVRHGFQAERIATRGLGLSKPIADNATEAGRAANRRVAVIVLGD